MPAARVIMGVDPGLRHTGVAILKGKACVARATLVPPGRGKMAARDVIDYLAPLIAGFIQDFKPDTAVVEQVGWQGAPSKIVMPLSHVAGALVGLLVARGVPTYLFYPHQKIQLFSPPSGGPDWTEHEKDAANLAMMVQVARKKTQKPLEAYLVKPLLVT